MIRLALIVFLLAVNLAYAQSFPQPTLGGGVATITAGTGISVSPTTGVGRVTITNTGVTSITGTANQVIASAPTGAVTLSLPQSIATTSTPTFGELTVPLVIGGTSASSSLSLQSTSGAGTTDFVRVLVGNNGATEAIRADGTPARLGNVGIGQTAPTRLLHVGGGGTGSSNPGVAIDGGSGTNGGPFFEMKRNGNAKAYVGTDSGVVGGTSDDLSFSAVALNNIRFYTHSLERLRILDDGQILNISGRYILGSNDTSGVALVRSGTDLLVTLGDGSNGGGLGPPQVAFASLGSTNGILVFCTDCDPPALVDATCTSAGAKTGALAFRVNGAWKCIS